MAEVVVQGGRRVCRDKMGQSERADNNNNSNNKGVCVVVRPRMTAVAATMRPPPAFRKVEIVYYLSRNGHLEHPHYIEVTHLSHQQLRLKDFMDRLTVLRGKGMPSLYSWSCKRSYKNGYVWNDLAENDVIYPSQGAEYVLKGSELQFQGSCTDKFHHLQLANSVQPKRNSLASKPRNEPEEMSNDRCNNRHHHGEEEEEEDDQIEEFKHQEAHKNGSSDLLLSSFSSPPSSTASSTISDKANNDTIIINNDKNNSKNNNNNSSKRFEDGDQVGNEPLMSRNSMLLSLIACGGSASFRKAVPPPSPCTTGIKSGGGGGGRVAVKVVEDNETTIGRISEDPKLHGEEKEYFSGSIVESITMERIEVAAGLKKSSSHNEERSTKTGLGGVTDEEVEREKGFKGKCIPRKKSYSKHSKE